MSSAAASTCARKITKNMAGLSLDLSPETLTSPPSTEEFPITACSPSTPSLEFDWSSDDSIEYDDDSEAQYVYIPHDSPFYRVSTPCSSAYIAFASPPFTCDALREDGTMFSGSPYFVFREKADYEEDLHIEANLNLEWSPLELDDGHLFLEQSLLNPNDTC